MDSYFLLIDKPECVTSQKCINHFKRKYKFKKIGHNGTLDPFATGLLFVGVNEATKFLQYVPDVRKTYEATLKLGERTETMDNEVSPCEYAEVPDLDFDKIQNILNSFLGEGEQIPPMFSAIKKDGKKLYELAREGKEIERQPRPITIHSIDLISYGNPYIKFSVTVSRGTYIRVLGEDIAKRLGTLGHLSQLRRTEVCGQNESHSNQLEDDGELKKISIQDAIDLPLVELSRDQLHELSFGRVISTDQNDLSGLISACFQGHFLGVLESQDGSLKPLRLISDLARL